MPGDDGDRARSIPDKPDGPARDESAASETLSGSEPSKLINSEPSKPADSESTKPVVSTPDRPAGATSQKIAASASEKPAPIKPAIPKPDNRHKIWLYAGFLFALVLAVEPEIKELLDRGSLTVPPPFYSYSVRRGMSGGAYARRVAIVTLTPGVEPQHIFDDVCSMRDFIARTIVHVREANAGLIAILRSFSPTRCTMESSTVFLREALIRTSKFVPVVIGANTKRSASQGESESSATENTEPPNEAETASASVLPILDLDGVNVGVLGLSRDNRRIPLVWSCEELVHSDRRECLGIAAEVVRTYDPLTFQRLQINRFLVGDPFSAFLPAASIPTISATALFNGTQDFAKLLHGRVVIIADYSKLAVTNEFIGRVQEAVLQGSYIESLFEGKISRPIKVLPFLVIYTGWIVFMQASFWRSKSPTRTFLIFGLIWLAFFLALSAMGYFLDFWKGATGVAALGMKFIESKGHTWGHDLGGSPHAPHGV